MTIQKSRTAELFASPFATGALVGGAILTLYVATLAPTTALWDASEYITAAKVLGLPHPPGNPLFVIVAHLFGLIPIPLTYAGRINLLAALCSAFTAFIWFLITERVLDRIGIAKRMRIVAAAAGTIASATAFTVWNQSVVNEKVYMLSLALIGSISCLMIRWIECTGKPGNDRRLVVVSLLLGTGYAVHPAGLLPALATIITVCVVDWRKFLKPRLWLAVACAFLLGLTPFVFEPIRAAQSPALNEGAPTGCGDHLALSCTFSTETYARLKANINREQYAKPSVLDRQASFDAQVGMMWLYFKWQWIRDPYSRMPLLQELAALVFLALGIAGALIHWREDRPTFAYWCTLMVTLSFILVYYLNFKYGFSQATDLGDSVEREVRDRDYFFVWLFSAWGVWVAVALASAWRRWRAGFALLSLSLVPLAANASAAPRRNDTVARNWGVDILNSAEPYGIVITIGDNDTFPLWYAQNVEGVRQDVTVLLSGYMAMDWYARQAILGRSQRYVPRPELAFYRDTAGPPGSIIRMTPAEADRVPDLMEISTPQIFRSGPLEGRIEPGYLGRDDVLLLRVITDSFPRRAIYFTPGSSYPKRLGIAGYLSREGLLDRLTTDSAARGSMNLARTKELWNIYRAPAAIAKNGEWVDRASLSVPVNYAILGADLAAALARTGDSTTSARVAVTAESVIRGARMERIFAGSER